MQGAIYNEIELSFLESLINEVNKRGDQNTIQIDALKGIRKYVEADEALLILYDFENLDLASKKLLGDGDIWDVEDFLLIKESRLCTDLPTDVTLIDPLSLSDPIIFDTFSKPVENVLLVPLTSETVVLGAILLSNPSFDFSDERRSKFLELMFKGLANAIFAVEHNRQLIINKAELEASQWEILNSRNILRTFFDNIPSYIYVIDQSYTILIINRRRSERVHMTPQELVGRKCYEKLFGFTSPCPQCKVADAFNGIPSVRNLREWLPNQSFIQWEISTVPIRDNSSVISRAIVFDEDVTEKWIMETNLIETEKLASIGQLAANIAHEINNPLAAIIANVQLLLRDLRSADEDTIEALKLIETAGVRAAGIVGDLLKSARREKRGEFEEISLNDSIREAISISNFEIKNRNVTVRLDLQEDMPKIIANQNQLKGVWINLVINALGAIESPKGLITITSRFENGEFRVSIADNGKGIAPEHLDRIFEPFFTTKDAKSGTGLGLSVSRQVIKEHHGTINFETRLNKGTKFIIILPEANGNEL